ncbi:MAG: ABC transporter permease [Burkholderiales bacterium]|jgi:peptide/nickel transport system permease protein|nr:ABC transporter permease [Burkholderiales bacterium]
MGGLILKRLLATVPIMLIVATVVFLLLRLSPGDPARVIAGEMATEEAVADIRRDLGLDQPVLTQYLRWMGQLARGDLGHSVISRKPVTELIVARLPPTLSLALSAITLTLLMAIPFGVLAAWYHGRWVDRAITATAVLAFSVPSFVIGYLLILAFSVKFTWLPVQGFRAPGDGLLEWARHLVLPTLTLATVYVALITRITRASMLDILGEDFVRTARAKGVTERFVLFRHALRNAAVPIVTVVGVGVTALISGVVVTETIFNIAGVGRLIVDSVLARDYPVVQGTILFFSFAYIFVNLAIDVLYVLLDPRIRY